MVTRMNSISHAKRLISSALRSMKPEIGGGKKRHCIQWPWHTDTIDVLCPKRVCMLSSMKSELLASNSKAWCPSSFSPVSTRCYQSLKTTLILLWFFLFLFIWALSNVLALLLSRHKRLGERVNEETNVSSCFLLRYFLGNWQKFW